MKNLVFPHPSVCPSVETIFVDGIKFDICEFNTEEARREFSISDKRFRFVLYVEDRLYHYDSLLEMAPVCEKLHNDSNKAWRFISYSKADLKRFIDDVADMIETVKRLEERKATYSEKRFLPWKDKLETTKRSLAKRIPEYFS